MTTPENSSHSDTAGRDRRPVSLRRRALFTAIYVVYAIGIVWIGLYVIAMVRFNASMTGKVDRDAVWNVFYPKVEDSGVLDQQISSRDSQFDVLLLGGSVLEQVAPFLESELKQELQRPIRIFDFCRSAHTSRDSMLKYSRLADPAFDLVVVYHGINDVRMNCCPDEDFRDDYTHCHWYRSLKNRMEAGTMNLPRIMLDDFGHAVVELGEPKKDLIDFGRNIKTRAPFEQNIETIVQSAEKRGSPVVLMTFAYYLAPGYTIEKFKNRELDYGRGAYELQVEVWGNPEFVPRTIDAHNEAVRSIAQKYESITFVDQSRVVPRDGKHFTDICHLTDHGCRVFAENVAARVVEQVAVSQPKLKAHVNADDSPDH